MSIYDKSFILYIMLVFMSCQALYQAVRFKRNKSISHKFHAFLYAAVTVLICLPFGFWCGWWIALKLAGISFLQRLAIYHVLLNYLRDKKPVLTYNGKGTTGSWQNKVENLLPKWFLLPLKIAYILAFILYTILI